MSLDVRGLCKRLGGRRVVDDVSLFCDAGEITILTGANGAGKSTLLALIAGLLVPDRGVVEIRASQAPDQAQGQAQDQAQPHLGYVPEAADPPGHMTGDELFALIAQLKRTPPLSRELRDALDVSAIARRRIGRLSLGERRRICLAAALIGDPDVLVLDEPTNGLDAGGVVTLVSLVEQARGRGAAVLIATHDHEFAGQVAGQVAGQYLRIADGRLLDDA